MKVFGSLFEPRRHEPEQEIPVDRMVRIRTSFRRRLSDQIEDVLHRACADNDLKTAMCLYEILKDLHIRRQQIYGRERRISDEGLVKAREALTKCRQRIEKKPMA
jgi:hypothetical protein